MSRRASALRIGVLAFLSGIPGLVYEVVWTRQVGLIAGGQIEAISVVLVAFFGGLALGSRHFGLISDRSSSPLRLYGLLEIAAALLAASSVWTLRVLGSAQHLSSTMLLCASVALLMPTTFLLGGTLPALLRWLAITPKSTARHAGVLVGANTVGAVFGVAVAVISIPAVGLRMSLLGAAAGALLVGTAALVLARSYPLAPPTLEEASSRIDAGVLITAFLLGVSTLGFEVLAARFATVRLGSSLYAWGFVLALFLIGLAVGNFALSQRARNAVSPALDLGRLEVAAACSLVLGLAVLRPEIAVPSAFLGSKNLIRVATAVLPATFCMGAAFPLLVRLALRDRDIGTAFGRLSAANTFGGIVGAVSVPFVLLPAMGSIAAGMTLAAANAAVGLAFLRIGSARSPLRRTTAAALCLVVAGTLAVASPLPTEDPWVLFVAEGRQATAVVTSSWGNRTLFVDGDPEASTVGDARRTEELLASLPLLLHPAPESFLEIGLGSGVTLGTATRFAVPRIDGVEIAEAVIRASAYFEPDNRGVASSDAVRIIHADARRFLASTVGVYDVVSANTVHPWSIGASGLYSREYFSRIAAALRPGGIAVQWLPIEQIDSESLTLILRTFFDVFPEGGLWWGAGNIIAQGSRDPMPAFDPVRAETRMAGAHLSWRRLGWAGAEDLPTHLIADADDVRAALGDGDLLVDDRPLLELYAARGRVAQSSAGLYEVLVTIAEQDVGKGAMLFWLESLGLRASGDEAGADAREALASDLGLAAARRARTSRQVARAERDAKEGRLDDAARGFDALLKADPDQRVARFGRARVAIQRGAIDAAIQDLERVVADWPDDARAWNELAGARARRGELSGARRALENAIAANPYDIRILANAGLIAVRAGDRNSAQVLLEQIRRNSPMGQSPQEKTLIDALGKVEGS